MRNSSKFIAIAFLSVLLVSSFGAMVSAQSGYNNQVTTPVTIGSDGTFSGSAADVGVSYSIQGFAGATGSVTAAVYNSNPQTSASIPNGISLSRFVVITFNMNAADFIFATISVTYTDADVSGIQTPFTIYKYVASSNSFIELTTTVDTVNKVITIIVTSIDDPLFAIGGLSVSGGSDGVSSTSWIILAVSIVVIVVLVVFGVWYFSFFQYMFKSLLSYRK
jgi:type III secretory pathway component EscU